MSTFQAKGAQCSLVSPTIGSPSPGPQSGDSTAVNSSSTYQAWADGQRALVGNLVSERHILISQLVETRVEASEVSPGPQASSDRAALTAPVGRHPGGSAPTSYPFTTPPAGPAAPSYLNSRQTHKSIRLIPSPNKELGSAWPSSASSCLLWMWTMGQLAKIWAPLQRGPWCLDLAQLQEWHQPKLGVCGWALRPLTFGGL